MSEATRTVLVAGVARSSTTWLATLLAAAAGTDPLNEPDNHHHQLHAAPAKLGLGSFPVLRPGDAAIEYAQLWQRVIAGTWPRNDDPAVVHAVSGIAGMGVPALDAMLFEPGERRATLEQLGRAIAAWEPPDGPHPPRVVKSVQISLALEWFAACFPQVSIVVVERHPLDVTASWQSQFASDLGPVAPAWRDMPALRDIPDPPSVEAPLTERIAWRVGLLTTAQRDACARIGCEVVHHEDLCEAVDDLVPALAWRLGLPLPAAAAAKAAETDRPGSGYEINRVREGLAGSARDWLAAGDRQSAERMLARFPLSL